MSEPASDSVSTGFDPSVPPFPPGATPEQKDEHWLRHVYAGDKMPQLTLRAVGMGALLGMLMAASNLYTTLAIGWAFGVAITACVMSFVIWNGIRLVSGHIIGRIFGVLITAALITLVWWKIAPTLGAMAASIMPAPWPRSISLGGGVGLTLLALGLGVLIWIRQTKMSVLEGNCMQSTASAAGYSTGSTLATMFGALLLLQGVPEGGTPADVKNWDVQPIWVVVCFTLLTGLMGVFLAIPMKRQMINYEGLRFPSGVAAAETLRNLHSESKEALARAYVLLLGIAGGALVGVLNTSQETLPFLDRFNAWVKKIVGVPLRIPESLPERGFHLLHGKQLQAFNLDLSVLLIAAGVITRMRVCLSMFAGSLLLYLVVTPALVTMDQQRPGSGWRHEPQGALVRHEDGTIARDASVTWVFDARQREDTYVTNMPVNSRPGDLSVGAVAKDPARFADAPGSPPGFVEARFGGTTFRVTTWALWGGTALMVFASLASLAVQWRTVARAFGGVGKSAGARAGGADGIEVPTSWMVMGMLPIGLAMVALQYVAFGISWWAGAIAVALSFFLVLVACRATGETDTTPIGAMGKVMQLLFAVLHPGQIVPNLASAGIAANSASSSADLLTDLKSGYLLGANPRKQFLAQFVGVFFGTIAVVPIWYLMVPTQEALEKFAAPGTRQWEAVARVLTKGIDQLPQSAQIAAVVGAALGILLPILEKVFPKARAYLPSAMGLGLSWVIPFSSSAGFFLGAVLGWIWEKAHRKSSDTYSVGLASGLIAGESLIKAIVAMTATAIGLLAGAK